MVMVEKEQQLKMRMEHIRFGKRGVGGGAEIARPHQPSLHRKHGLYPHAAREARRL
jgi:hypothetical protein